jgi:predicted DNA repair protein MutK
VKEQSFLLQALVVSGIAFFITIAVYSLVAGIVKLDDAGLHLLKSKGKTVWSNIKRKVGSGLLIFAPILMKTLTIVGTAAMFLVGGCILTHGFHSVGEGIIHFSETLITLPLGGFWAAITPTIANGLFGVIAGGVLVMLFKLLAPVFAKFKKA